MKIVIVFFKADKFFSCKDRENLNFFVFLLIEFEIKLEKTNIYEKTFIVCMCLDDCFANDVELDGEPFKYFAANRDKWAVETAFTYPGAIQYYGPSEVCDLTTRTLALEHSK